MKILNQPLLDKFIAKHANARSPISSWRTLIESKNFTMGQDFIDTFGANNVDHIAKNHYLFDIGGNNYRIFVKVVFTQGVMIVKGVYTHAEYDKQDFKKQAKKS